MGYSSPNLREGLWYPPEGGDPYPWYQMFPISPYGDQGTSRSFDVHRTTPNLADPAIRSIGTSTGRRQPGEQRGPQGSLWRTAAEFIAQLPFLGGK